MDSTPPNIAATPLPRRVPGAALDRAKVSEFFDRFRIEGYLVDARRADGTAGSGEVIGAGVALTDVDVDVVADADLVAFNGKPREAADDVEAGIVAAIRRLRETDSVADAGDPGHTPYPSYKYKPVDPSPSASRSAATA